MKIIIPIALLCLILSSCVSYEYSTLSSKTAKLDTSDNSFYYENDSLRITYNFYGTLGTIGLTVKNKTMKPVFVYWTKSSVIVGDRAYNITSKDLKLNGSYAGSSYKSIFGTSSSGEVSGTLSQTPEISFIPPGTEAATRLSFDKEFELIAVDHGLKDTVVSSLLITGYPRKAKTGSFTTLNTPLAFKIYLTVKTDDPNAPDKIIIKDFYLSRLLRTSINPDNNLEFKQQKGNTSWKMR